MTARESIKQGLRVPRIVAFALVAAALAAVSLGIGEAPAAPSAAVAEPTASASGAQYKRCRNIAFRKHVYLVSRIRMKCKPARKRARNVLRRRRGPFGWTCSLPNIPRIGSCVMGRKGFLFQRLR